MTITDKCVNAIRVISAEEIERAHSGHPGICMGAAPIAFEVFSDFLKFSYRNPKWDNRDRFVLSAGHGSAMLYCILHMFGYDVSKEDLENFRQLGSKTPGHPEYGKTPGVETCTGPLGQGIGNAVGMAVAEEHLASIFNREGYPVVDHFTYVLCGDGDLEEGMSYEACSFAGAQKLGKLIMLYDRNDNTIDGDIHGVFDDDVPSRFASQGWQVIRVPDATDLAILRRAIIRAKSDLSRPSIIICTTKIGHGSPLEDDAACHGAPLGEENLRKTKENLDWYEEPFTLPQDVKAYCMNIAREKLDAEKEWNALFKDYEATYPELAQSYREFMGETPVDFEKITKGIDFSKPEATRASGAKALNAMARYIPNLMSGSADLAPSTRTDIAGRGHFTPQNRSGSNIRFGVREHAMAAICNGIALHGGLKVLCSTFFSFSDYMKAGIRMSALNDVPVIYVMTHDSIGVGEDGPTHQPMEQLISLRSIPGVNVYRPADGNETAAAYIAAFTRTSPTVLVLSRQSLPQYGEASSPKKALTGGYVLSDCEGTADVLLIGSGSEVELCMNAQKILSGEGVRARVVSMPCMEEFERQTPEYKESVLPSSVKARVCVEAASHFAWHDFAGDCGEVVAMSTFGRSGPPEKLFDYFGFTAENVAAAARRSMEKANKK